MRSEALTGRVVPLPLAPIGGGFQIAHEVAKTRRLTPACGASRRCLNSPPDMRIDVIAFDEGGSVGQPWPAGRVLLQCLHGFVHVVTREGGRDLVEGDVFFAEAPSIRTIAAYEKSEVMATVILPPSRPSHDFRHGAALLRG